MTLRLNRENLLKLPSPRLSLVKSKTVSNMSTNSSRRSDTSSVISSTENGKTKELKDAFQKFDSREITRDQFVEIIQNEIGIPTTKEFEQKITRTDVKFTDIVKTLQVNQPKSKGPLQSSVNPIGGDFARFRKNVEPQSSVGTNPKREELVVNSVRSLLNGEISKDQFIEKLKSHDMPIDRINKELRNFGSSNQEKFKDFGAKIMRELRLSTQQDVGDKPGQMSLAYLSASKEFAKIAQNQEKLTPQQIDEIRKQKEERILVSVTGQPMQCATKTKGPSYIKANKTNGNFLAWEEPTVSTINEEIKPSFKKKYDSHRDKLTSVNNLLSDNSTGPVYDSTKIPQKILKLHKSSFSFYDF
jgi:hypothetical protein